MNLPSCLWSETGRTLYATLMKVVDGTIWNGSSFESFLVANYVTYILSASESPSGSYRYVATWPSAANVAGDYIVRYFRRTGAAAAIGVDPCVYEQWVGFDGAALVPAANGRYIDEAITALATHGDSAWATATGFSTFSAATDSVIVGSYSTSMSPGEQVGSLLPTHFAALAIDSDGVVNANVMSYASVLQQYAPVIDSAGGVALASTGLDAIPVTAPTGVATTFREMVVQTWRRLFCPADKTATSLRTLSNDGQSVLTTQVISASGANESQGMAQGPQS